MTLNKLPILCFLPNLCLRKVTEFVGSMHLLCQFALLPLSLFSPWLWLRFFMQIARIVVWCGVFGKG